MYKIELREHPFSGTGHPEQMKYIPGVWSRRIDKKNRLRYTVIDNCKKNELA